MAATANDFMIKTFDGKDYLQVAGRVIKFREKYPTGGIRTEWVVVMDHIIAKATIYSEAGEILATGHATLREAGPKERWVGREFERAETAALGRALSFAGFGTVDLDDDDGNLADSPIEAPRASVSAAPIVLPKPEQPGPKPVAKAAGAEADNPPSPFSQSKVVPTPLNNKKVKPNDGIGPAFAKWTTKHEIKQDEALAAMGVKFLSEWNGDKDEMLDLLRNHFNTKDED